MTWSDILSAFFRKTDPFVLFAKTVNDRLTAFHAEVSAKSQSAGGLPVLEVRISKQSDTTVRTPEQQATQVVKGRSWTCASSHMTDKARHVALLKNGKYVSKPSVDLTPQEYAVFTKAWNEAMSLAGLLNYAGKHGFNEKDAYHVELPGSKLPFADKRVQRCIEHYAKMTRDEGKPRNIKFENNDERVRKFLEHYEKATSPESPLPPSS